MALVKGQKIELSDVFENLNIIKTRYDVPNNCKAGDTVILDGIECVCVAADVTIQGSGLRRIAVDKNYDLGYYQKYVGMDLTGVGISQIRFWRWGGYGTSLGNTSTEVGYGLQNTVNCLANTVSYTRGTSTMFNDYPLMWRGVNDFRASHSDKWFVPSANELLNYVYPYKSRLTLDTVTGGVSPYRLWSSSEYSSNNSYHMNFEQGSLKDSNKYYGLGFTVRLCRAF